MHPAGRRTAHRRGLGPPQVPGEPRGLPRRQRSSPASARPSGCTPGSTSATRARSPSPNDYKVRTLAGRPLIFCRDSAGEVHAYLNSCPHRGTSCAASARARAKHFQCFYHAWTFANNGDVSSIPDADAYESSEDFRELMRLREVPRLESHEGYVFISFDPDVPPLREHLGEAAEYMTMIEEQHDGGMTTLPGVQLYSVLRQLEARRRERDGRLPLQPDAQHLRRLPARERFQGHRRRPVRVQPR